MILKKYLPFEKYVFTSKLPADEIKRRLADNVAPKSNSIFGSSNRKSGKPYEGYLAGSSFTINRIINYKNSFLPVIKGTITPLAGKTEVQVTMQPFTFVIVFMSFWLGIIGIACLCILVVAVIQVKEFFRQGFSPATLIPFGMFVFGCLLVTLAFKAESGDARVFLKELFEAEELRV